VLTGARAALLALLVWLPLQKRFGLPWAEEIVLVVMFPLAAGVRLRRARLAFADALHMGIHGEGLHPKAEAQHNGGGLRPHAGQFGQPRFGLWNRHLLQEVDVVFAAFFVNRRQ